MKALISQNLIYEIVEDGKEFEVHGDFSWVDCPNDITDEWKYVDGVFKPPVFEHITYDIHRKFNYPSIQEQLDILFHQGFDGWKAAIQAVKEQFPKPEVK